MIPNHSIFGRRQVLSPQIPESLLPCQTYHRIQREILHTPLQYPAAHQPTVDKKHLLRFLLQNDHANDPVIAEPVFQGERKRKNPRSFSHLPDFRVGITNGSQVELVASLRE